MGITAGRDGNVWFTEESGNKIGRITRTGTVTEFAVPTSGSAPESITAGPDGNLWFTELSGNKIGRITPAGAITEFLVPTTSSAPMGITAGSDGNLWFTEDSANQIGQITPAGVVTEFPLPTVSSNPLFGITAGPDRNLWFAEEGGNTIGRLAFAGTSEPPVPTVNPMPALSSLAPNSATAGEADFTLTVTGGSFVAASVVQWNGTARPTTFMNSGQLRAAISTADIPTAGTAQVAVVTPAPGGGTSTAMTFTISVAPGGGRKDGRDRDHHGRAYGHDKQYQRGFQGQEHRDKSHDRDRQGQGDEDRDNDRD